MHQMITGLIRVLVIFIRTAVRWLYAVNNTKGPKRAAGQTALICHGLLLCCAALQVINKLRAEATQADLLPRVADTKRRAVQHMEPQERVPCISGGFGGPQFNIRLGSEFPQINGIY
jgi:hypothetical protein